MTADSEQRTGQSGDRTTQSETTMWGLLYG